MKMPPKSILYNDVIELRLISPRDVVKIFGAVQESLPSLKKFLGWAHYESDITKACSIYADFEAKSLKGEEANFAGFDPKTGEFLCCASLTHSSPINSFAFELGYWVSAKYHNKGIGTNAARILIVLAFTYFEAQRVSIVCNPNNVASLKVIENCNFQFEGTLRNFQAKKPPEVIEDGFSPITDVSSFSLIPEDIANLRWFNEIKNNLNISRFCEDPQ